MLDNALALDGARGGRSRVDMTDDTTPADRLERAAYLSLLAFAAALQVSIAAADILLTLAGLLWLWLVVRNREHVDVPRMFWPLAAYGAATFIAAVFSVDPRTSIIDCKQLVLFLIVPIAYRLLRGRRSMIAVDVVITVGALSATVALTPASSNTSARRHKPTRIPYSRQA